MASTLLNELGWNRDAIERQLAHCDENEVRAAYNYAEYLPERVQYLGLRTLRQCCTDRAWSGAIDPKRPVSAARDQPLITRPQADIEPGSHMRFTMSLTASR
jgi:hypothetical protein